MMESATLDSPDSFVQILVCTFIGCQLQHFDDETGVGIIAHEYFLVVGYLSKVAAQYRMHGRHAANVSQCIAVKSAL